MGLDTVEIILAVERRFNIEIPNKAAEQIATVSQLHQYVVERTKDQASSGLTSEHIYEVLADLICSQLGVKREDVRPDAHFVDDLGAS